MSTHLVQRERSFKPLSSPSVGKIGLLERLKGRRMEKNRSNHRQSRKTIAQSLMQDEIGSPNFSKDADRNLRLSQQARRRTWSVNTVMSDDSFLNSKYDHDSGSCRNVMEWMEKVCPEDLVPKILSFTGPQSIASISKVNRTWNLFISRETTWRIICEELYKWKQGDEQPESWFDFYRLNPCVPVDYSCIHTALTVATSSSRRRIIPKQHVCSIRVLLRPGNHFLSHAVEVRAISGTKVTIQTMEMPPNIFPSQFSPVRVHSFKDRPVPEKALNPTKKGVGKLRILLNCVRPDVLEESETEESYFSHSNDCSESITTPPKLATIVFRSRRQNEPVFRVQQGVLQLKNVEIQHYSHGTDIWNGNAAVQIQPFMGENNAPTLIGPRPVAVLYNVQISSRSGRGIVNIDGGNLIVCDSVVRDCAATGIYIGGPGSEAIIHRADVIRNGIGNRTRRGVARGHSGIYLEQGITKIHDCNVSNNTLTGISVVSPDNAFLTLENSDIISNGTYQLELPTLGTLSRRSSLLQSNRMSVNGDSRNRSGLTIPDFLPLLENAFSS